MMGNEHKHWEIPCSAASRWRPEDGRTLALIGIVLVTLTFAALEAFLSGEESLSAIEAAMGAIVD